MRMKVEGLKSALIKEKDDIVEVIEKALESHQKTLQEKDVLVITSKVLAVCQGRIDNIDGNCSYKEGAFKNLIQKEAGELFETDFGYLTLNEGHLIPNAGIDRSNVPKGKVVLWPENSPEEAKRIQEILCKKYNLNNLGVIISDSTCSPLRPGVHSISIGNFGFEGVEDCRKHRDLYNNEMKVTMKAVADNLATAASVVMGETNESTPFVIISDAPAKFTNKAQEEHTIEVDKDLFFGIYNDKFKKFASNKHYKE